jgi:hypothetical protein
MTEAEKNQLVADSEQVRDETVNKANTATRVGTLFTNIVNFAYSAWLGITDESTYLLTPKEIREGEDSSTKYQTEDRVESQIDAKIPVANIFQFDENANGDITLVSLTIPNNSTLINFKHPVTRYGTRLSPKTGSVTFDLTGNNIEFNKSYIFMQSATVPSWITSGEIEDIDNDITAQLDVEGTFSTDPLDVNLVMLQFIDSGLVTAKIKVFDNQEEPEDPTLFAWLDYNDSNKDLVADPTLINKSIYADDYVVQIFNPADASSVDLGSGNRALSTANNATGSLRARHQINVSSAGITAWDVTAGITVVARVKYGAMPIGATAICSSTVEDGGVGFRFYTDQNLGLFVRLAPLPVAIRGVTAQLELDKFYEVAFTYDRTTLTIYARSVENSIAFYTVNSYTQDQNVDITMDNLLLDRINNTNAITQLVNKQSDGLALYNRALSVQEVQEVMNKLSI